MPPGDERSNYRLVQQTLLDRLVALPTVHRIPGELGAPEAAERYDRELDGVTLDLALNGIGADGHTASLFPAAPALEERERRAVAAEPGLEPFVERVTLTPPVFGATRLLVYLVAGRVEGRGGQEGVRRGAERGDAGEPDPRRRDDRHPRRGRRVRASSGVAARPGPVGHERAEALAVAGDEPVGRARRAPDRAVRPDDVSALVPHCLR